MATVTKFDRCGVVSDDIRAQVEEAAKKVFANYTNPPTVVYERVVDPELGEMAGWADFDGNRIVVSTGEDAGRPLDVFLHEAAHFLTQGDAHGDRFWCVCDALSRAYGDAETVENNSFDAYMDSWEHADDYPDDACPAKPTPTPSDEAVREAADALIIPAATLIAEGAEVDFAARLGLDSGIRQYRRIRAALSTKPESGGESDPTPVPTVTIGGKVYPTTPDGAYIIGAPIEGGGAS